MIVAHRAIRHAAHYAHGGAADIAWRVRALPDAGAHHRRPRGATRDARHMRDTCASARQIFDTEDKIAALERLAALINQRGFVLGSDGILYAPAGGHRGER